MAECVCGSSILPSDIPTACSMCSRVYQYKCTPLTKAVAKLVSENENLLFKCNDCLSSQCCGEQNLALPTVQKIEEEMKKIAFISESISGVREQIAAQINDALKTGMEELGRMINSAMEKAVSDLSTSVSKELENMKCSFFEFNSSKKVAAMNVQQGTSRTASEPSLNPRGKKRKVQEDADATSDDVFVESISFADVVKSNTGTKSKKKSYKKKSTANEEVSRKARPVIVIKPKESNQSSEDTRKVLNCKLDPKKHKISNFRNGKDGSIIAECATGYNVNVVKDGIQSDLGENYNAVVPSSVPRLKVKGMSEKFSSDDFIMILKDQNEDIAINEVKVIRMYENPQLKYNKYNAVIEVDKETHSCLLTAGKVFIKFDRCRVVPEIHVLRCFKCGEFGHMSMNCKNCEACSRCSGSHKTSECTATVLKCINCKKVNVERNMNLDDNHGAFSHECEVFKRLYNRKKSSLHFNE
ncbi:uncharacterized protein LOC134285620 [Aedes albopictus]|uniref:CCHC-type domain-containing protein n=1 Tax=Aedes albopictus TaxID=7160 RepID=A0ABM1ZNG0_AEDAL